MFKNNYSIELENSMDPLNRLNLLIHSIKEIINVQPLYIVESLLGVQMLRNLITMVVHVARVVK